MTASVGHFVRSGPVPASGGLAALTLASPSGMAASFVPGAGMVGCALTLDGEELLGLRGGMPAYLAAAKTFGIPLLAPWANRLGPDTYRVAGQECTVAGVPGVHRDEFGTAIHGLLAGAAGWQVLDATADAESARLAAQFRFDHDCPEFDGFPFPHLIDISVGLRGNELTVTTMVSPLSGSGVPVAFGWHPYFTLPGVPRHRFNAMGSYGIEFDSGVLTLRADAYYQSSSQNALSLNNKYRRTLDGFPLFNASATWSQGGWDATLWIKNIGNEEGITGVYTAEYMGTAPAEGYFGNGSKALVTLPRTVGLTASYRF